MMMILTNKNTSSYFSYHPFKKTFSLEHGGRIPDSTRRLYVCWPMKKLLESRKTLTCEDFTLQAS